MQVNDLAKALKDEFGQKVESCVVRLNEVTIEIPRLELKDMAEVLRDSERFAFEELMDVCGVDYLEYGLAEWLTEDASTEGFERGVQRDEKIRVLPWEKPRFAVVYHLLSIKNNHRLRIRCFLEEDDLVIPSICDIWASANWFEREVFDLYGVLFDSHPDLRRILTDYGFIGHPFRKDFPISGNVEMRYDAEQARCVYEKVEIDPRILVPKVIRPEEAVSEQDHD